MRQIVLAACLLLALAPAALADSASSDSPRDAGLPASQDISHVGSSLDPATGIWTVAVTLYGAPSADAWGNLYAGLYKGASQCVDSQDLFASFQQTSTLPGSHDVFGSVIPPDGALRAAQSVSKAFDGDTVNLQMSDTSLLGTAPTCLTVSISHNRLLDRVDVAFAGAPAPTPVPPQQGSPAPPLRLGLAIKSTHLTASRTGVVKVSLKPFNQAAAGVITLRQAGVQLGRASYKAKTGAAVTVPVRLSAKARRSLKRHRSLSVTLTATAQAGTQVVTKAVRARVRP